MIITVSEDEFTKIMSALAIRRESLAIKATHEVNPGFSRACSTLHKEYIELSDNLRRQYMEQKNLTL